MNLAERPIAPASNVVHTPENSGIAFGQRLDWQEHGWTVVRFGLGLLLLLAAGLKLAGQGASAVPQIGWFATPTVQIAVAEWEIVLGLWLMSNQYRRGAWLAALVTLVGFAVVSGYLGWIGVASCGCFGAIHASPWWAFGVDLAAIILLMACRKAIWLPNPSASERRPASFTAIAFLVGLAGCLLLATLTGTLAFGSPAAALAAIRGEPVQVHPEYVDFGAGEPGATLEASVEVQNRSGRTIRIVGGTSDCSCVTTASLPCEISGGDKRNLSLFLRVPRSGGKSHVRKVMLWTDDREQPQVQFLVGCSAR
jgi:hypothetical protein